MDIDSYYSLSNSKGNGFIIIKAMDANELASLKPVHMLLNYANLANFD